ncbi:MAG: glycosyltransferase involved in cell wall biosynthesis [Candidatus Azotimanducaceae bacterium]|jgi:glycosyltransferase involved in cell wall biosynthesis
MKPKILIIITRSEIGGAQNYVLSMVSEMRSNYEFKVIVGSDSYLSKKLTAKGVELIVLPQLDSKNIFRAVYALRRLIILESPNIINTHSTLASVYGRLANLKLRIPIVYSVHGWFFAENTNAVRRLIGPVVERVFSGMTSFWITETHYDQKIGTDSGAISNICKSRVIANGIPKPITQPRKPLDRTKVQMAFVGRISFQKNPLLAVESLSYLPQNYLLTMFCDNAKDIALNNRIEEMSLSDRIILIDDETNTASIINSYDLLLVTSRYEGMPLSIIEAMSAGLPIVSTNVCGLRELVIDRDNGILVDGENPEHIAKAITELMSNPAKAKAMGRRSVQLYEEKHTLPTMISNLEKVFSELLTT